MSWNIEQPGAKLTEDANINGLSVGRSGGATNTVFGDGALPSTVSGSFNIAVGRQALSKCTTGSQNIAIGSQSLFYQTTGSRNVACGTNSLQQLTTGTDNTGFGNGSGNITTTGSFNTSIGSFARPSINTGSSQISIGYNIIGKGNNTAYIGGSSGAYNQENTSTWRTTSDLRLKKNVSDNSDGLDKINAIRVCNFEYRTKEEISELSEENCIEKEGVQLGVIAQEMLPECVSETSSGVLSVNTDKVLWYLVNAVKQLSEELERIKNK